MLNATFSHRKALVGETANPKDVPRSVSRTSQDNGPAAKSDKSQKKARSSWPSRQWWLMAIPSFIIATHGAAFFFGVTVGDPEVKARIMASLGGVIHIGGSLIAMGLGPFQFLPVLRQQYPAIHRWVGWVYVAGVTFGGTAAFIVTFHSLALTFGKVGFAVLALAWLETARRSIVAIRQNKDVRSHQAWMTRNFALTYAAVMLRWQFPLMLVLGVELRVALSIAGWVSWMPNLVFVEYCVLRKGISK
ncbi:hypothetical protein EsH8_IX_001032 [Colletotrichum jinshuiense]